MEKSYNILLGFTEVQAESPLEATKKILAWIQEEADKMIYDVEELDENGNLEAKYTVDLSENDEDAVLPFNE